MNCLLEWTHAKLSKLVRELMEEQRIDQEVDFKVLRSERRSLTDAGEESTNTGEAASGVKRTLNHLKSGALRRSA
jgi:phosphoglycolate phosphatase-like HAD superfamily hydrolase